MTSSSSSELFVDTVSDADWVRNVVKQPAPTEQQNKLAEKRDSEREPLLPPALAQTKEPSVTLLPCR